MKNIKGFITFLALFILVLPGLSFAEGNYHYGSEGLYEAPPVKTQGIPIENAPSTVYTIDNPATIIASWVPKIGKTKAERDADKAALEAQMARDAEMARVAYNPDGTFAYGYTNGSGAQYKTTAKYVDARTVKNGNLASAGSAVSGGFLPKTLWGWILLILLFGILFALGKAFSDKSKKKSSLSHAH